MRWVPLKRGASLRSPTATPRCAAPRAASRRTLRHEWNAAHRDRVDGWTLALAYLEWRVAAAAC